mmetsp:Transcript_29667/g.74181  ORF Transcript_29667/g.74181 Transcript_29667/m.74181 type:complete len:118 (-) Transcript_29667:135-488(-)
MRTRSRGAPVTSRELRSQDMTRTIQAVRWTTTSANRSPCEIEELPFTSIRSGLSSIVLSIGAVKREAESKQPNVAPTKLPPFSNASLSISAIQRGSYRLSVRSAPGGKRRLKVKNGI